VLSSPLGDFGFWQNEILVEDQSFLGFINSAAQYDEIQPKQVLTAYYCLPSDSRKDLVNIQETKEAIISKTIKYLEAYFKQSVTDRVEAVFINAMGHAMPIPGKGYLFSDKNPITRPENLAFAGVDHHRLPLLFEAIDSGIESVKSLYRDL